MLSDRLKHFHRVGIFERIQYPEIPPRVEYCLTPFGKKFQKLLNNLDKLQAELDRNQSIRASGALPKKP